jgi:hypothetical protein
MVPMGNRVKVLYCTSVPRCVNAFATGTMKVISEAKPIYRSILKYIRTRVPLN